MNANGSFRLVVLISGRGSNLQAIIDGVRQGRLNLDIPLVVSNRPAAAGIQLARNAGLEVAVVDHRDFPDRGEFEIALWRQIDSADPDLIVLAGFMRILSAAFVHRYQGRMVNIHPSLLPRYTGLDTHQRVLEAGDEETGASIHFVTPELDSGPVISQVRLAVEADDTPDTLAARLLPLEHQLMLASLELFTNHSVQLRDDQVYIDETPVQQPIQLG